MSLVIYLLPLLNKKYLAPARAVKHGRTEVDQAPSVVQTSIGHGNLPNVTVSDGQIVALVIDWHEAGFDFADAFHLALSRGQEAMKTFDAGFIKNAKKLTDRRVERP